jgi:hypothetical protein
MLASILDRVLGGWQARLVRRWITCNRRQSGISSIASPIDFSVGQEKTPVSGITKL